MYTACSSFEALRQSFEKLVAGMNGDQLPPGAQDHLSLIHKLEVQRIELELQNHELRRANRTLDNSRREIDELQEFAPLAIVCVNAKGIVEKCNEAAAKMFADPSGSIVGKGFSQLIPTEDHDSYFSYRASLASHPAAQFCEIRVWGHDRQVRYVRLYARPLPSATEKALWQYALVDFTEARQTNERLKQGENFYRILAANLPNGAAFVVDRKLTYVLAEGQALELVGMKPDDLEGKALHEALGPELAALYEPHYRSALNGKTFITEHNSHGRYFQTHFAPLRDDDGSVYAALAVSHDITDRKRAEEEREQLIAKLDHEKRALVESEQRYRIMGEILPYGIWLTDAEGKAVYTSQSFLDLLDMSMEEMQGFGWTQKLVPEDVEPMMKKWMHSVHTGENWDSEHRIIDPDGKIRIVLTRGRPVRDASGKITAWAGINLDITERKAVEEALAQKHELLEGIYHHIPVLFVLWDPHLERFMLNRQAEEVLRYTTAEANAGDFMRRVYPDDAYREKVLAFMQSLEPGWQEWVVTTRDGEEVPIEWANIKLSDDTRIGIGVDLREQKKAEAQLRESHRELNEFTYALTHNVKAPFRAIQNYACFLLEDLAETLEGQPRQFLEGLEKAVALANRQFEDLEALYKVKDRPLNYEDLDIGQLLDEIVALHEGMPERELVTADRWPTLRGEQFLLRQILMALVNNGFKFNQATVKRVEVFWQRPSDRRFEIVVRDNGIGIDSRYHDQILRLFQRLHTDSEYEGTGIGLAIVSRAVKRIGGELRIESAAGRGSTFVVSLPTAVVGNSHKE